MKNLFAALSLSIVLLAVYPAYPAVAQDAAANPALEKFKTDMKTAVLNGSITVDQLKQLQANAETLKSFKENQQPGAPVDLLTPYRAVSNMRAIMATVKPQDREILQEDMQAVLANKKPQDASADPPNAGKKLGKDVFTAVMFGKPTESQVKQLQESLNDLQKAKGDSGRPFQALMALKKAKGEIETVMNAGSFRDQDRQAVLDDLNNLGPQGGGGGMRRRG
jgi:DNA repair exonuclease SbcCD ATPase subunit